MILISDIQSTVARNFRCDLEQFNSRCRSHAVARPRQIAMLLAREMTKHSLPRLAGFFKRDHTTIMHGIRAARHRIAEDEELARKVDQIRWILRTNYLHKRPVALCLDTAFPVQTHKRPTKPAKLLMEFGMEPEFARAVGS